MLTKLANAIIGEGRTSVSSSICIKARVMPQIEATKGYEDGRTLLEGN